MVAGIETVPGLSFVVLEVVVVGSLHPNQPGVSQVVVIVVVVIVVNGSFDDVPVEVVVVVVVYSSKQPHHPGVLQVLVLEVVVVLVELIELEVVGSE